MRNFELLECSRLELLMLEAEDLLLALRQSNNKIVTAESCTGGLIASLFTHHSGFSDVVEGGFVTYSNKLKQRALGVKEQTLLEFGAVSAETVREMAEGALKLTEDATISIAVSGIAGPSGGSAAKPTGLVWFGVGFKGRKTESYHQIFTGDRIAVRTLAVEYALKLITERI